MSSGNFPSSSIRFVGWTRSEIDTPCLCLDLAAFGSNLKSVASAVSAAGKHWRPHANCHKTPQIAQRCLEQGAIGITCTKVSEAEVFASTGIKDILIAHLPVGAGRVRRLAELCKISNPIVTCDHYVQAAELSIECMRLGVRCRALVEINIGMNRTGVRPGRDALELARGIQKLPGLQLAGIMGYEGHSISLTDPIEKRDSIDAALGILSHASNLYHKNGLCCEIVSAGGTGSLQQALLCPALTEVQAGGAIFGDPYYLQMPDVQGLTSALTLLTTVVSRPSYDCAVLDAGLNAITADKHPPTVKGWDDARVLRLSSEHTVLELGPSSRELRIGDQVQLVVGYSDLTTMLHDEFLCFRGNRLESVWPISARGKFI